MNNKHLPAARLAILAAAALSSRPAAPAPG
ncbi:hypothetical protein AVHM3334_14400 [Acidovorax sp. SUPP3334]|nr:hypothetical protein AVHM3334_14400 [Acidovorax sp. SUPP3334]